MEWTNFPIFAYTASALWLIAPFFYLLKIRKKSRIILINLLTILGIAVFGLFITMIWIHLDRPPMRTLGETRLWYSAFLPIIGIIIFNRWKYVWLLAYSNLMAILFVIINLTHPETYTKTLMPALQSPCFVPHVIVYILAYALLGVSWLVSINGLFKTYSNESVIVKILSVIFSPFYFIIKVFSDDDEETAEGILKIADNIVYIGYAFLSLGLLFGALWAKEAWGHYWTWDPKETWAFLTFLAYLIYIHFRYSNPSKTKIHLWILTISFIILMLAWYGVNYMPSAENSVHTYTQ